jgi:RNA polymerase sigma factor (sigma-70 family)|tara:strand:- start:32 stop:496 length:465 start_codon:yes stop_codon:yes gene_type:complete
MEKINEDFIKRLRLIAQGIAKGNCDPDELVNGAVEYLMKNKNKYKDHPNLIALAVLKMKGLYIDFIRKNKNLTSLTDEQSKEIDIVEKLEISSKYQKVLKLIKSMGEKCQEILMLAADGMSMQEMHEITGVKSLGTVLSRLSNCRKELKVLLNA